MKQYIDKIDVVAEIESYINSFCDRNGHLEDIETNGLAYETLCDLKNSIDTLEVKNVDEIIKNAEDHAYFAGSENTREKLIDKACKWWEVELTYPSMTPDEIKRYKNRVKKFRKDMEDK